MVLYLFYSFHNVVAFFKNHFARVQKLYALSIEQKHSEKLPYQCVQSANIRLISCCAHTLCHQYIIIIYTRYTNVQCTWILKSNYPCTFKITLQKHSNSCYRIACTHSIFYLYRWLYAAAYAYVFCLYIYNISQSDIGGSCSVRTQCLALLSSLKLSIFNRCLTKQANKLTGIKPQPFDWIFFQFKNVFLLFCFICLLILNMNFLIWYVFVCSFPHIHFG